MLDMPLCQPAVLLYCSTLIMIFEEIRRMNPALAYLDAAELILQRVRTTQLDALEQAADICSRSIAGAKKAASIALTMLT